MNEQWKLVPVVPTEAMLNVLHDRVLISVNTRKQEANILNDKALWAAVVAAAPAQPVGNEVKALAVVNYTGYEPSNHLDWKLPFGLQGLADGTELVDRVHVTCLQAEVAALQQRLTKVLGERDTIYVDLSKANDDALEYMTKMKRAEKECDALQQRLTVADQRVDDLSTALKYYADGDHFSTDDGLNWDSCSGEPTNILWHESEPWFIEDGWFARTALEKADVPAQATEQCQFPQSCTTMCNCNKARRRMDALGIDKDIDTFSVCLECWGTGSICTGILEASNTQCNACDGTGREKQP